MHVLRSATFWLTVLTGVLTVLIGVGLLHRLQMTSLNEVREEVQHWRPLMTWCRWALLAAIVVAWRRMCQTRLRQGAFSPAQRKALQTKDRMVLVYLLLIELAIGQRWLIQGFGIQ